MYVVMNNLFFIGNQLSALSRTGKVRVWHTMTLDWQLNISRLRSQYDMQGRMWHTMKTLAGKSLTVEGFSLTLAPFNMTCKVGVWHAMTQNWQVNHTVAALNRAGKVGVCHTMTQSWQVRLLVTANQWSVGGRSGDNFV